MTLTEGSRKRPRPCDDESCEFMPISKKINNLRIRVNSHDTVDEDKGKELSNAAKVLRTVAQGLKLCPTSFPSTATTSSSGGSCPDHAPLAHVVSNGGDNNPHYGAINRLLFEAHMQRQQRMLGASHQRLPEHCPGPSQL